MINKIILMGRLTADPELRQTASGIASCNFSMAVDRAYRAKDTGEKQVDFIRVTAWRQTAEFVSRYFSKGKMIIVEGSLRNNDYTDANGVKHYGMVVNAESVHFAGDKSDNANTPAAPKQQNQPKAAPATVDDLDLSDFEDILSEGDVPF